jgi:hypothetical protein
MSPSENSDSFSKLLFSSPNKLSSKLGSVEISPKKSPSKTVSAASSFLIRLSTISALKSDYQGM